MSGSVCAPLKSEGVPRSRSEGVPRSKSEGNLVEEQNSSTQYNTEVCQDSDVSPDSPDVNPQHVSPIFKTTNPFWHELSASNPFLDDIAQLRNTKSTNTSILKEDPSLFFREVEEDSSSGDELNVHQLLRKSSSRKSGKSKSVSELLDIKDATLSTEMSDQILPHDMQWLQHDREAYKMVWLSQRQLARSCLDLNTMSQGLGWAQTQVAGPVIMCNLDHKGGTIQLPGSHITVHVPQGHVKVGEYQEITLRAFLDPPKTLNHDLSCTVSPLLEVRLSNLNTMEAIRLEMKISGEVKQDPFSQVMGMLTCLYSSRKEGPFKELGIHYIYNDTVQMKLLELSHVMYIVITAQAKAIQAPATSVWDYIHRTIYVGIYGPKYIHPSFTAIFTLCGHSYMPRRLTFTDINRSGKNMSPVVFHLWGKHSFLLDQPRNLHISVLSDDIDFEVKGDDQRREIRQEQLKSGEAIYQQFLFSAVDNKALHTFVFLVQIRIPNDNPVTQFYVRTPEPAPNFSRIPSQSNSLKMEEIKFYPFPSVVTDKYPKFQDKKLRFNRYGVTLKALLRQNKINYFLEYFKGDTIALLGRGTVKAIGQNKVKEWYVGVLRGKLGLVHCKNVKVISKEQVIDMSESAFTTQKLLEQAALPFKKMTYIYSTVLTLVSEKILDWKALADALGYSQLTIEDFDQMQVDKETERVSYVVKKLKEDCHVDRNRRSFLYELVVMMWKPAYDFLYTWGAHYGESYWDVLQDLQLALDRMKNPVTKHWRELTGALILVKCLEVLREEDFHVSEEE
ncbi:metastasis-associated in colon cancer protein 1 isoform X2 [Antechinus flavipes]|uniref:metastasis-associated in colon cancer protein 1 isoform X2 n=1 Tax=Antechinus flavipes TaxID=38775 RepID=UPI00223581FE|nr:metastasis-associated in colon cancer protein 1 isoform X2 [Antechinus flavipes]